MKIFRGFLSVTFVFWALFGGSHPPVNPGNPIEDLVVRILDAALSCGDEPAKPLKKDLVGTWQMSLVSVIPPPPSVPLVDPIKKNSAWQISESGGRLNIRYDNSTKWYSEPFLVNFTVSPTYGTPNSSKTACDFPGAGKTSIDSIPFMPWSNISVNYTDSVSITMRSDDTVTATIKVNVGGQFTEKGQVNQIKALETITYTGVRK